MSSKTQITVSDFGKDADGSKVGLFTLTRPGGLKASILNFGGIVTQLHVPDKNGNAVDVVLGFDSVATYVSENIHAGAIVGRIAGRMTKGRFKVDGKEYQATLNEGENHVHGGLKGFDKKIWAAEVIESAEGKQLQLNVESPDGEEGFPGNLKAQVTYSLSEENGLRIEYRATTDATTPLCLTNHSYFNLAGEGDLQNHRLQVDAQEVVEVDDKFMPTGRKNQVEKGKNDFSTEADFMQRIPFLHQSHGDNYLLYPMDGKLKKTASLSYPPNGIKMQILTTATNLQLYSGVQLETKSHGKNGKPYLNFYGACFECQSFSDAPNHPNFNPIWLHPEDTFRQVTEYRFSID